MPQIPLVGGSQRLDPSSPVPVSSSESAAGNLVGNTMEGFGNAMASLGSTLAAAGARAKAQNDRLTVEVAADEARFAMLEVQAQQNAQGIQPTDRPDGFSGVQRFKSAADERVNAIAENLTPEQRLAFKASIGGDVVRSSTLVLANEVNKIEKNVPLMRTASLQGKAKLASEAPAMSEELRGNWELSIRNDPTIPERDKEGLIQEGAREIDRGAVNGMISRGANGNPAEFRAARLFVEKNASGFFDDAERDKMLGQINARENEFNTEAWRSYSQSQQVKEDQRKEQQRAFLDSFYTQTDMAGSDPLKNQAIMNDANKNPYLSPPALARIKQGNVTTPEQDNTASAVLVGNALQTQDFRGTNDAIEAAFIGNRLSSSARSDVLQTVKGLQVSAQKDPTLVPSINRAMEEVNSFKNKPVFDPTSGTYRTGTDELNQKANREFMSGIMKSAKAGNLTSAQVKELTVGTLNSFYGGAHTVIPVTGFSPEKLSTLDGVQKATDDLYADNLKNGKSWSPEKKAQVMEQLKGLKANREALVRKESLSRAGSKK